MEYYEGYLPSDIFGNLGGLSSLSNVLSFLTSVTGMSMFATALGTGALSGGFENTSFKLIPILILGYLFTVLKSVVTWGLNRFSFQYYITAQFHEGDPTYDWLILLLTNDNVWNRSKDFQVTSKTSRRKWGIGRSTNSNATGVQDDIADYVPTYSAPQLWRWNGYWIEVARDTNSSRGSEHYYGGGGHNSGSSSLSLTIYTFDVGVLSKLVTAARDKYLEVSKPHVTVHTIDTPDHSYGPTVCWDNVKMKKKRPLESLILPDGVLDSILQDAREFIEMEEWYLDAGIPHRRGYLLHGPPGTGKSSTIYAVAGELGMEIYSISLAASFVDDSFLQRAASSIPKSSIFLIEDIDCAFSDREDADMGTYPQSRGMVMPGVWSPNSRTSVARSAVTLSGLLNVLDGVNSEEGKLFFATTNYVDHLDAALIRPGRIDMKVEYNLSNKYQAAALFRRFYPAKHIRLCDTYPSGSRLIDHPPAQSSVASQDDEGLNVDVKQSSLVHRILEMSLIFAEGVPHSEFTTAELQGYLLHHKKEPLMAVQNIGAWVNDERRLRDERAQREQERALKQKKASPDQWCSPQPGYFNGPMMAPPTPPTPVSTASAPCLSSFPPDGEDA